MAEEGYQEVETYVSFHQNTVAQYIATRPIIDICLAAKQRPGPGVAIQWWEQEGLYLEGMRTEGVEETESTDTATYNYLSGEDTVVTTTLGTENNAPLAYAPGLELHHPIMSILGYHGGQ